MRLRALVFLSLLISGSVFAGWEEGVAALKNKDYRAAAAEFQDLVQQSPDNWRAHYMLGLSQERLARKEEALSSLRKAYDLNPNDLSVKVALGRAYSSARRYGEAAKLLSGVDAGSLPSTHRATLYQLRGGARHQSGDAQGALADYAQLAQLKPKDARIQHLYGTSALALDQMEAGIKALEKATQLAPNDLDMKQAYARALVKQGRTLPGKEEKKGVYEKAANLAGELVTQDASYANLMLKLSAELGANLYPQAVETGTAATANSSADWLAYYYLGQAYTGNQQYQEAVEPLEKAKEMTTKPAGLRLIWKQLGFTYEKQKKYAQSVEAYEKAGDAAGVARVSENQRTDAEMDAIEAENEQIEKMKEEARRLEEELKALEEGGGGR